MYAISYEVDNNMDMDNYNSYESSFKVLDSLDYSSIATVDVKRNIYDLCVNRFGTKIAVVENQGGYATAEESVVKIYSVGRKKHNEDEMVRQGASKNKAKDNESVFQEDEDDEPSGSEQTDSDNDHDSGEWGKFYAKNNPVFNSPFCSRSINHYRNSYLLMCLSNFKIQKWTKFPKKSPKCLMIDSLVN